MLKNIDQFEETRPIANEIAWRDLLRGARIALEVTRELTLKSGFSSETLAAFSSSSEQTKPTLGTMMSLTVNVVATGSEVQILSPRPISRAWKALLVFRLQRCRRFRNGRYLLGGTV